MKTILPDRMWGKNGIEFYFEMPTQVKFRETADRRLPNDFAFVGGIAYKDEIICGECGGIVKVNECEFIRILPWCTIGEEILGDEWGEEDYDQNL